MKQSIIILLCFLGFTAENVFAQPNVGGPAPKIQFSTAIGKSRAADFTKGKFVILEFWATWCGPCIGGFPHYNSLVKQFASDSVLFLSMTNETDARRITGFLATRARLDAINLLDDNGKTWKAFNISGIPTTVIIGKNGNVLWTGHVLSLTSEILGTLLQGKALPKPIPAAIPPAATEVRVQKKTSLLDFSLKKVYTPPANSSMYWGLNAEGQRTYSAPYTSLVSLLSDGYNMPRTRILVPKELVDYPKLELSFAVDTALDKKKPNMLPELLLKTLNLSAKVVTRDTMVWQMTVTDSTLLNKYKSVQNHHRSSAENETQLIILNYSFKDISAYLENHFKAVFTALPDIPTNINGVPTQGYGYDLIMPNVKSFDELNKWLKKNIGMHFVKKVQPVKFLQVNIGG